MPLLFACNKMNISYDQDDHFMSFEICYRLRYIRRSRLNRSTIGLKGASCTNYYAYVVFIRFKSIMFVSFIFGFIFIVL